MHGGFLPLLHQDHLPVLGNVVFNGGHSPGVVDNHDGYAGKQQRFNQDAHALVSFMGNLLTLSTRAFTALVTISTHTGQQGSPLMT